MKRCFLCCLVFLLGFFFISCSEKSLSDVRLQNPDNENFFVCDYKGTLRKFSLWLPSEEEIKGLIFMLHGYGETVTSFQNKTHMNDAALSRGYAVCYVSSGNEPGWNYGLTDSKKDDAGFLCSLANYFQKKYSVSSSRTFLCGFSNGAFLSHCMAIQKQQTFGGVISVAGLAPLGVWNKKKQNGKCSLFLVYGTKDDLVLSEKNNRENVLRGYPYIEDVCDTWIKVNSLEKKSENKMGNRSVLEEYEGPENRMWILTVLDYPHQWPEERSLDFLLSDLIMDFVEG